MSVHLLITAGRGPQECHLVVPRVAAILAGEARAAGLTVVADPPSTHPAKGCPSIVLVVTGDDATRWASTVVGPVQWIATSPLRPRHARRNWFVEVSLCRDDEPGPATGAFDERDVTFEPVRSGGPGGQRRNKVATAVRARHTPSGTVVVASGERTLSANRAAALARLAALATQDRLGREQQRAALRWAHHNQLTRGNPVRVIRAPLGPKPNPIGNTRRGRRPGSS